MVEFTGLTAGSPKLSDIGCSVDVTDPTMDPTGTNKKYNRYDENQQIYSILGIPMFPSALCASTANLTATYNNGSSGVGATLTNSGTQAQFTVDGVTPPLNAIVLIGNQSSAFQNGLYSLTTIGSGSANWQLTRTTWADTALELVYGTCVQVAEGVTNSETMFQLTFTGTVTVGTTALAFTAQTSSIPPWVSLNGAYSLGGMFYSTATQAKVLAATATANQIILSGSNSAPSWSTATFSSTYAASTLLYSNGANAVTGLTTANNSTLVTSASGVPSWAAMGTNGYVLIGSGSGAPVPANITGSMGVTVTNGANTIALVGNVLAPPTLLTHTSSPYTVLSTDQWLSCDVSAGVLTIKLPNAPTTSTYYYIKDRTGHAGTNNISVTTVGGSVTIDGSTTYTMNSNLAAIIVAFNGTSYEIL